MSYDKSITTESSEGEIHTEKDSSEGLSLDFDYDKETNSANCSSSVTHVSDTGRECAQNMKADSRSENLEESNMNPVIWQKFQFLISVLKDIQFNIKELDSILLDRHQDGIWGNWSHFSSSQGNIENGSNNLEKSEECSKTDETKLNEILALLHLITSTLSSLEQNPLLTEDLNRKDQVIDALHSQIQTPSFADQNKENRNTSTVGLRIRPPQSSVNTGTQTEDSVPIESHFTEETKDVRGVHRFSNKTKSLRQEIESVTRRKQVLDETLCRLLKERELRKQYGGVHDRNDSEAEDLHSTASDAETPDHCSEYSYIQNIKEGIAQNEAIIMEMREDENQIPGLAETGLSSEINCLNKTIKEILSENQQLHAMCFDGPKRRTRREPGNCPEKNRVEECSTNPGIRMRESGDVDSRQLEIEPRFSRGVSMQHSDDVNGNIQVSFSDVDVPGSVLNSSSFNNNLHELLLDQTYTLRQLQKDRESYNEKFSSFERKISDLIKLNHETKLKFSEEFHALDVENCRLEKEVRALRKENRANMNNIMYLKSPDREKLQFDHTKKNSKRETFVNDTNPQVLLNSDSFQALKSEVEMIKSKRSTEIIDSFHFGARTGGSPCPLSLQISDAKYSSLPPNINRINPATSPSSASAMTLNLAVDTLRSRIDNLEATLSNQKVQERAVPEKENEEQPNKQPDTATAADGQQQPEEFSDLKEKLKALVEEQELSAERMEELMQITREVVFHLKTTREELARTKKERNILLHRVRSETNQLSENIHCGESLLKMANLIEKFQEKCQHLQSDLEKAQADANKNALERDRLALEKENVNLFLTSTLAQIEEENVKLRLSLKELQQKAENESQPTSGSVGRDSENGSQNSGAFKNEDANKVHNGEEQKSEESHVLDADAKRSDEELRRREYDLNVNWQRSLVWLQRCLTEENLHNELLKAAEKENSARVAVLEEVVKQKGFKYQWLLGKYKKLHAMLLSSRADKKARKRLLQEFASKIHDYNSTTSAIEDNYKVMLSSLGSNIRIAVEIVSSHMFFSPIQIHPCPELSVDPAFWFAAQCSRLRWLQSQLRQLCLRSWTGSDVSTEKGSARKVLKRHSLKTDFQGHKIKHEQNPPPNTVELNRTASAPNSPARFLCEFGEEKEIEMNQSEPADEASVHSSILSSLNEAEINLTNQQTKLARTKASQFNTLIGILEQSSLADNSSIVSPSVDLKTYDTIDVEIHSIDNSAIEISTSFSDRDEPTNITCKLGCS